MNQRHELAGFDSGEPKINDFLIRDARAHAHAGFSTTWVIADPADRSVWGFVALAAASQVVEVKRSKSPKRVLTSYPILDTCPYDEVPVIEVAFIGVRQDRQGRGVANALLRFAIRKIVTMSQDVGMAAIILDALTEPLLGFYRKFGFERLPYPESERRRMLLTMADARVAAQQAGLR